VQGSYRVNPTLVRESPVRHGLFPSPLELTRRPGRWLSERRALFMLKSRMPQLEYVMNIFYIIGVIVVILVVAGFLGLR
jgi:hypothetical protein